VLRAQGATDRGRIRPTNEDYFATDESLQLCVLADGMGGHRAGEIAARIAVDAVAEFIADARHRDRPASVLHPFGRDRSLSAAGNLLRTAIQLANAQVLDLARTSDAYAGMGTTIATALVADGRLSIGSVGDSRAYMLAGGRLRQLTRDDSWMASILAHDPDANPGALRRHPLRSALTNVVGAHPRTEVQIVEEPLRGGELLLFSTDGVHDVLEDVHLEQLLAQDGADVAGIAAQIVRAAIAHGSRDNCTAVVARYTPD
jgi:serine/threonine protein phosphatase PrpC